MDLQVDTNILKEHTVSTFSPNYKFTWCQNPEQRDRNKAVYRSTPDQTAHIWTHFHVCTNKQVKWIKEILYVANLLFLLQKLPFHKSYFLSVSVTQPSQRRFMVFIKLFQEQLFLNLIHHTVNKQQIHNKIPNHRCKITPRTAIFLCSMRSFKP
jgi:hypothetical protein